MTAATVAMLAPLCRSGPWSVRAVVSGIEVERGAGEGQVGIHADRTAALLRDLTEEAGRAGEQGEATQQLDRQAEVGERRAADTRPVEGQLPAEDLLVRPADRLEQP